MSSSVFSFALFCCACSFLFVLVNLFLSLYFVKYFYAQMESKLAMLLKRNFVLFKKKQKVKNKKQNSMMNILPNEMVRYILVKLDAQLLITIRGICKGWKVHIEDICREKRTLMLIESGHFKQIRISNLSNRFNGLIDFSDNKNCVVLKSSSNHLSSMSKDLCILLSKLFPRIEHFALNSQFDSGENLFCHLLRNWSTTLVTLLIPHSSAFPGSRYHSSYKHLNSLTHLKRLDFLDIDPLKLTSHVTVLSRLQHYLSSTNRILSVLPHLGPHCTSLYLFGSVSLHDLTQWPSLNLNLVKSLTHLRVFAEEHEVLPFVCANFVQLRMLSLDFTHRFIFDSDVIHHLARLSHLSQLSIHWFVFDWTSFDSMDLPTLNSVHNLSIQDFGVQFGNREQKFDGDQFCRLLTRIFSDIQQITIKHRDVLVCEVIAKHLDHLNAKVLFVID